MYSDYELHAEIGAFSATWKRKDGEYGWGQLGDVAKQFPDSSDVYDRANTRGLVLGSIAGVGGGLIGYTLGWNLTAEESRRWSSSTQIAMYSVGGGLIVVSIVAGLAWHNPANDFADVYNRALRRSLGQPEPPSGSPAASLWVPRPLPSGGYGWRF
jgi:hypothetical protein